FIDQLAFPKARGFDWSVSWFLLGIAYGSIWSIYPFACFMPKSPWVFVAAVVISAALVFSVRRAETWFTVRVEG
ncbi:MAG: hypothetical protein KDA57_23600, partial [Planctomycetales bacterium]|nr:hypothetical protein [Planctomycetales bacterium]